MARVACGARPIRTGFVEGVPAGVHSPLTHTARPRAPAPSPQVRAPMPPTYVFLIDVSQPAVVSGAVAVVCATIRECLDSLPGDDRTQVAFITFDR